MLAALFLSLPISKALAAGPVMAGQSFDSIFETVWIEILREAQIDFRGLPALAKDRRRMFVQGKIVLDCCSIPEWRSRPDELNTQLFTSHFFFAAQLLMHRKDRSINVDAHEDMAHYTVAVIKGHDHVGSEHFGNVVWVRDFEGLFSAVVGGLADAALVNEQEFLYQTRDKKWPVVLGKVYMRLPIRARVHKSRADLLPRINDAIGRLKASGKIDALVGAAIRDKHLERRAND